MMRRPIVAACATVALFVSTPDIAFGHGGVYRGPGDVQGPPDPGGPGTGDPGNGPPSGGPGGGGPTTPGGNGPTTPGGGPGGAGGPGGRGGATTGGVNGKRGARPEGFESWQFWWEYNQDRFINVRQRLADSGVSSGTPGFVIGNGRKTAIRNSSRPTAEEIEARIVPSLKSVLDEKDSDIVDSAVLALGRIVKADAAGSCFDELEAALSSEHNSVQQSTILALGVLGSKDAAPLLLDILNDTAAGRKLLSVNGGIQDLQRAFAGLALGYVGAAETIPALIDTYRDLDAGDRSIKASILVSLGLFADRKEEIVAFFMEELKDEKLDQDTAGQIPISLARLGADVAIPQLVKLATGRKTDHRLEESSIIALGMLAKANDEEVLDALYDKINDGQNDQARHFSIIALADIAERALRADRASNEEFVAEITKKLLRELVKSKQKQHEPWAGLALAIIGRNHPQDARQLFEINVKLEEKFREETNSSYKPAYALALGIIHATGSAAEIQSVMLDSKEKNLQGYCAIALGLMKHQDAKESLRKFVQDDNDPRFRLQIAKALGLMGDTGVTALLVEEFKKNMPLSVISSLARALGLIGDSKAIAPLEQLVADTSVSGLSRAFGCVALGLLAEKDDLPWNARVSIGINYRTQVPSLREVLDIL